MPAVESFDVLDLVEQTIQADLDVESLLAIDDSDLPAAPNVVEFMLGAEFLDWTPFPRQIQVALHAFLDYCPMCSDRRIINNMFDQSISEILDKVTLLRYGVCPKCGLTRADFVKHGKFKGWVNEVVGVAGQRSSKSYTTAVLSLYLLHRYLKLPTIPYRFFGLAPTLLHLTFVALTYGQASDNLWDPFVEFYEASPWFREYNALLKRYEHKFDKPLVEVKQSYILYRHKNLICYPSGPDKRKLRGRTRFGYAIDEFAYFDSAPGSKSIKFNASEIYAALENSLATVRAAVADKRRQGYFDVPDAYSFLISSPVSKQDKIMIMLREADKVSSRYAFHYATWEFNPNIRYEHLEDYFKKDPVTARRDFGADPPLNDTPLIANSGVVRKMFRRRDNIFVSHQVIKGEYAELTFKIKRKPKRKLAIGIDAGLSNNSFAVAVLSLGQSKVYIEGLLEIIPLNSSVVNFASMQRKLSQLVDTLEPEIVIADRWNSITFLHTLEEEGVPMALQYSLTYKDIKAFSSAVYDGSVVAPQLENGVEFNDLLSANFDYPQYFVNKPVSHLAYQMLTVRDTGRRVDKGLNSTDDLFRAVAVAYYGLVELLTTDNLFEEEDDDEAALTKKAALGVVRPKSVFKSSFSSTSSNLGVVKTWRRVL